MNTDNVYDLEMLTLILKNLENELEELSKWSVYNGDFGLDDIADLQDSMTKLSTKLLLKFSEREHEE